MRPSWVVAITTVLVVSASALRGAPGADDFFGGGREPLGQPLFQEPAATWEQPLIHGSTVGPVPGNPAHTEMQEEAAGGVESRQGAAPGSAEERPRLNAFWDHGAVLESSDKAFRFHLGGRFDFDNTWYQTTESLPFELQDGAAFRRARLRADGTMCETIDFMAEVNFAKIHEVPNASTKTEIGRVGLTQFYVTFKELPLVQNLRVGHFWPPISLEGFSGANVYHYYMERSPGYEAFLNYFHYVTGVLLFGSYLDDRATAAASLTRIGRQTVNPFGFGAGAGEYAATGRLTGLPIWDDEGRRLVHLGIAYSCNAADDHSFSAANRPLVRAGAGPQQVPNIVQTGTFYTPDPLQIVNAELAAVYGRFSMSAEYQLARGTRLFQHFDGARYSGPRGNVTYQGVYVEGGLFLDPRDHRRYDRKMGIWDRLQSEESQHFLDRHTPVELLCRYSYLDLVSGSPVLTSASGAPAGRENDLTAGVSWFINPQLCFTVNYVYTHLAYVNDTSGDIHGLACRLHLDF